jgi:hypothetical protein
MRSENRSRTRSRVSRRQVLTVVASAGVGAAAVSVSRLSAATDRLTGADPGDEPIVVHLRDAASGTLDVFVGESLVQVKDRDLARRLRAVAAR